MDVNYSCTVDRLAEDINKQTDAWVTGAGWSGAKQTEVEVIIQVLWPLSDPVKMASGQNLPLVAGISLQG